MISAWAPGRVNLIGDHVDHAGGPVLPMAIDLGTTVRLQPGGRVVRLASAAEPGVAEVAIEVEDAAGVEPPWARYVAGVVAELGATPVRGGSDGVAGGRGTVETTLPVGAGLSSSAALELAVALALGFRGDAVQLALLGQRAEQRASGVPCGVMDQLASAAGVAGSALLIDCATLAVTPVPLPAGIEVLVVHSGQARTLAGSAYAERRGECDSAAGLVGPLPWARRADVERLFDPMLRRRARHVVSECERVRAVAASGFDRAVLAEALAASHASLRDDFEVSTPALDALVDHLTGQLGVIGARLTGAGFGGCAVALVEAGATGRIDVGDRASWLVRPSAGARLLQPEEELLGFRPLPSRGPVVTNALIDRLREDEPE